MIQRLYTSLFRTVAILLFSFLIHELPAQEGQALRVGVVGLTHAHVHWILGRANMDDMQIVGIVESNRELAERYSSQYGFSMELVYDELESMLNACKPEAVTAFNPIYEHLEVVEQCALRGVHVMVEKPLAVSFDHARRMAKAAREGGIHLLTNYETTWYGSNHRLEQMVNQENALGEIRKMVIHDGHKGPIEIGCNSEFTDWLTDPVQNGGGALTDFGCYGANLMTWLMEGERPLSVLAVTQQIKPEMYPNVDDEATIILTYPKAQGIIQASWNWPYNRKDTHVYGQNGYVQTIDASRMRLRIGASEPEREEQASSLNAPENDPFAYLNAVIKGKANPEGSLSSLEINLTVMEILDAARRSAKSGKQIKLPAVQKN